MNSYLNLEHTTWAELGKERSRGKFWGGGEIHSKLSLDNNNTTASFRHEMSLV
jgi:hypothetical protein